MNATLYTLWKDGRECGPYSFGQLRRMWNVGSITAEALFWTEGMADWQPMAKLMPELEKSNAEKNPAIISELPNPDSAPDSKNSSSFPWSLLMGAISVAVVLSSAVVYLVPNGSNQAHHQESLSEKFSDPAISQNTRPDKGSIENGHRDEAGNAKIETPHKSISRNGYGADNSKVLNTLPKLAEAVEAYTLALETTVDGAGKAISGLSSFANSAEVKQAFAANPDATQETINKTCSDVYSSFHKGASKYYEILDESLASEKCSAAFREVSRLPECDLKVVLDRIFDNCTKAQKITMRYAWESKSDVAEQMRQINEARTELPPLAQELRAELELLRAMIRNKSPIPLNDKTGDTLSNFVPRTPNVSTPDNPPGLEPVVQEPAKAAAVSAINAETVAPETFLSGNLLKDEFNGSAIDSNIWQTSKPFPNSSVVEAGGFAVFRNRGRLVSVANMAKSIEINGSFIIAGESRDQLKILTRTNGGSANPWGELDKGIGFFFQIQRADGSRNDNIAIYKNNVPGTSAALATGTFNLAPYVRYNFKLIDDGTNLALYLNNLNAPFLTASDTTRFGNRIGIYNAEGNGNVVKLDYIGVSAR